ncbi:MAG: FAD-binding oxidoreductase [Anaerolineaceae bacterium]|nr:FAD-binding oxidoreductase [Anaerolineaceae bacterium]
MKKTFDAIVVGAGYIGSSVAYHLCAAGLKTALFDQGSLAAGASRANFGNIQILDMELANSTELIRMSRTRFASLEAELDWKVGLRQIGGLLLIENEAQWQLMEARLKILRSIGIPAELLPAHRLHEVEPLLEPIGLLGGLYHAGEGQVDPFQLIWGYLVRARQKGLQEYYFTEVTDFTVKSGRIEGVVTPAGRFSAGCVILCSGAYTRRLGRRLGREWNVLYVLGQAMVSEPVNRILHNHVSSASFFEVDQSGEDGSLGAKLAIGQSGHGHLLLGEAMVMADHFQPQVPFNSLPAVAACAQRYFPALGRLRILRSWSSPVASTADNCPLLGPVAGCAGLFLATAFRSTVISTPLVGELMVDLVTRGACGLNLGPFLPDRNIA